ncbi:MAG: hypothetical protein IKH90_05415 [Ruminococcus sp.]|nr:hypothetical protein [Ruminococcus sp.]
MLGDIPVSADDTQMYYQYPLFAYSSEGGAITSNASVFCVNGNIAANGTIKTENTININGQKKEKTEETMPVISLQGNEKFFTKNAEMFGNILYGYSAHAGGFSKFEPVAGGAIYSMMSDYRFESPEDSENIKEGYEMYNDVEKDYDYIHIRG